jgi:hypothetical protein
MGCHDLRNQCVTCKPNINGYILECYTTLVKHILVSYTRKVPVTSVCGSEFLFLGEHPAIDFANTQVARRGLLTDVVRLGGCRGMAGKGARRRGRWPVAVSGCPGRAVDAFAELRNAWRTDLAADGGRSRQCGLC